MKLKHYYQMFASIFFNDFFFQNIFSTITFLLSLPKFARLTFFVFLTSRKSNQVVQMKGASVSVTMLAACPLFLPLIFFLFVFSILANQADTFSKVLSLFFWTAQINRSLKVLDFEFSHNLFQFIVIYLNSKIHTW